MCGTPIFDHSMPVELSSIALAHGKWVAAGTDLIANSRRQSSTSGDRTSRADLTLVANRQKFRIIFLADGIATLVCRF